MTNKIPFMQLILAAGFIATVFAGGVIYELYQVKLEDQKAELQKLVRDQAELFDYLSENGSEEIRQTLIAFTSDESILRQNENPEETIILDDQLSLDTYGETGRFLGGKIIGENIVFFRVGDAPDAGIPAPIHIDREGESPMREALQTGEAGFLQFTGFEGHEILVASQPVESLGIGLVARIDLAEVQGPYIRYGVTAIAVAFIAMFISWLIYRNYGATYIARLSDDLSTQKEVAKTSREELEVQKKVHAETEAKLEESEKKYETIFYSSEDPMWLMLDGKFIHCNEAAVETFRLKSIDDFMEVHPSHFSPLQQPDGTNSFLKAEEMMKNAVESGYSRFFWTHKRFDGEEFPAEVTLTRINIDGRVGLHAMVRDITEEKIVEENLQKALVDAERANVAKSEFLASMSHEFRTPLNAILGFSEMLKAQYLGPLGADKYGEYVGDIHTSGAHLLDLINDILDISAIEAGKNPMEKTFFDMMELMEECIATVEPTALECEISIHHKLSGGQEKIYGHRRGIKQIIINIMANAIKYNHAGGEVTVESYVKDRKLHIIVEDNGFGIEKDFLPRILEPFSRADENAHMAQEGTGLGLSICQKLVEAYEGTLDIESTYGIGTKVTIVIPTVSGDRLQNVG